jgi:glycosyltransferase involved in cell wall biosynthesis
VLNWFLFGCKILFLARLLDEEPDVIIYSSPALVGYLAAERLARRYGARLVLEVRDIWPLTLIEIGGFSERHPLIRLFQWIEDRAYRNADLVISNLRGAVDHMAKRGLPSDRFLWLPNGVALEDAEAKAKAPAAMHERIPLGKFVVGYAGTLGEANSIATLIEAAVILQRHPSIVFVFLGAGKDRAELEESVRRKGLESVIFLGSVPKSQVQNIIARFDISWVGAKASPLYQYGIAANKIFDYLLAECPVLLSYSGNHDPIRDYDAGMCVPAENPQALADAILEMQALPAERRREMGVNGRVGVEQRHDFAKLAEDLDARISIKRK